MYHWVFHMENATQLKLRALLANSVCSSRNKILNIGLRLTPNVVEKSQTLRVAFTLWLNRPGIAWMAC